MRKIFLSMLITLSLGANAQGWTYDNQFKTDVWNGYIDRDIEVIDCSTGNHEVRNMYQCFRKDAANSFANGYVIKSQATNTNGLYGKVAAGVAAARPKRSSTTSGRSTSYSTGRAGTSYNHATSQAHIDWVHQKQAQQAEARERERERKRQEAIQRKIEDDNRAAAVGAATNARLQGETNRRIQRDYYNANEGAYIAQQRARQAHRTVGPQFARKQTSNVDQARMLRGQNKPRRVMYPQRKPQNSVRPQLAKVERKQVSNEQTAMLRRALMVREELRRKQAAEKQNAEKRYIEFKGIKISENAVSTLGKDWNSPALKTGPLAPPPTSKVVASKPKYVEPEWLTHEKYMREMLNEPPLTQHEETMMLLIHECLD